jgi:G:T-mismatch repair DNA endonuclease (very short patch repair protein)
MQDKHARELLLDDDWRILTIWECAIRRRKPIFSESSDLDAIVVWIKGNGRLAVLSESGLQEFL